MARSSYTTYRVRILAIVEVALMQDFYPGLLLAAIAFIGAICHSVYIVRRGVRIARTTQQVTPYPLRVAMCAECYRTRRIMLFREASQGFTDIPCTQHAAQFHAAHNGGEVIA